jgi:prepilin-type N-terminal cleavage/methylation domain-containing protein
VSKLSRRTRSGGAFTLVELVIVIVIVAILALIAIPLYTGNTTGAIMSEGVASAGTIRTALRVYASQNNGSYANASMSKIPIGSADLEGKYFAQSDYSIVSVTDSTYTIKAGPPSKTTKSNMPYYTVDQNGSEQGTYYSNQ